jgi:hypothetical protein
MLELSSSSVVRRRITPDTTIPELVRSLGDDSKQLVGDEMRLAKLEMRASAHHGGAGAMLLAIAFAALVVCVVAASVFVATLIGRIVSDHMWLGALIVGVVDLAIGAIFVKRGLVAFAEPSHALEEIRAAQP